MRTDSRIQALTSWANYLAGAARSGALAGKPMTVSQVVAVPGPRCGALEIFAGLDSGRLLRSLRTNDAAALRQFVPWQFKGDPQVFMSGRYVRVEAGWPDELAETLIRLSDLSQYPRANGRWVAGKLESGESCVPGLNDQTPHFLVSGATGSGKSVALRSAVLQLSADPTTEIVLVDGKQGESLRMVERLPGVVGPVATDGPSARAALGWACAQMAERYERAYHDGRLVIIFDEFQEMAGDAVIADLLRKLAAQGRAAGVHCLLATQHPTVTAFGDASTRRNLVGKIALRVADADASRVAVGGASPRADHLLGAGDSYAVGPGACHRVQLAYVDEQEIGAAAGGQWRFMRWPDYEPEDVGQELAPVAWHYCGDELAVSVVAAAHNDGRPTMVSRLADAGLPKPGAERAIRLLRLGRDTNDGLNGLGYAVCLSSDSAAPSDSVRVVPDVW